MTVKNIYDYLNNLFPVNTACDFDNAGFLVGDGKTEVKKALVSLDCSLETVKVAKENGCELIITHHPVIFAPLKNILEGSIAFELVKSGISVISMHTNLDMADGGVSEWLCKKIGLKNIIPVTAEDGFVLRAGEMEPASAECFAEKIKQNLGGFVRYVDGGKEIKNVLVCSGSGGEFIETAMSSGYDAFVSAEIKHHLFLQAKDFGISLFDAGHFNTEDIIVDPICELLSLEFGEIEFIAHHSNSIKVK